MLIKGVVILKILLHFMILKTWLFQLSEEFFYGGNVYL